VPGIGEKAALGRGRADLMERQNEMVSAGMHLAGTERPDADILIAVIGDVDDDAGAPART